VTPLADLSRREMPTVSSSSDIRRLAADNARLHSFAPLVMLPDFATAQKSLRVTKSILAGFMKAFMNIFYLSLRKMRRLVQFIAILRRGKWA
jgi:hypothetical protein